MMYEDTVARIDGRGGGQIGKVIIAAGAKVASAPNAPLMTEPVPASLSGPLIGPLTQLIAAWINRNIGHSGELRVADPKCGIAVHFGL